jgi:hypothetical protein
MKRAIIVIWCVLYIFLLSGCKPSDPSLQTNPSFSTADTGASSPTEETTAPSQSTGTTTTPVQEDSYKDLSCTKISDFQEISFCVSNSRTQIYIVFPKPWTLKKSDKGYNILQGAKVIGSVTVSDAAASDTPETVHSEKKTMPGVDITHRIDCIASEGKTEYIRTLSYRYKEVEGSSRTLIISVPYQQIDDSAVLTMMIRAKKQTATDPKMGVLPLKDNRKSVLILGNSFVGTSRVGIILQEMCGSSLFVEAQSRGYARITTYVQDADVMNRIRSGDYSAVILCGLYDSESVTNLEHMINACASSNTKLAIFPAHNESSSLIGTAGNLYPSALFLDWKEEINSLINSGIDQSHFCIADSHKHSTPLAGYVGAHMIYRAIFGKVPTETSYSQVSQSELALLGNYPSTGIVSFSKPDSSYPIKAG